MIIQPENKKDASHWLAALKISEKDQREWIDRGRKIVKRYRDDRKGSSRTKQYNILWSNIRTVFPAIYAKAPKADVSRRNKDNNQIARCASEILERVLQYEIDFYSDFDSGLRGAIIDRLLCGRGVCWVRFEAQVRSSENIQLTDDSDQNVEIEKYECSPVDYVFWEDFRNSNARSWEEITWIARRVYLGRDEIVKRFGEKFRNIPLTNIPAGIDEMKNDSGWLSQSELKKAKIWEIWDKSTKKVIWISEDFPEILDERDDPLELDGFFPCAKPLFSTMTTDTLIPVPDFVEYQDQANEIDELTNRIYMLVKACKVVGVYDASETGIQRMLSEGVENTLIPVNSWQKFSEKGVKGSVDFLPLSEIVSTLSELYKAREACKQVIYEVTGLSDIIRGSSLASETATAQQIKSQYASLRLKENIADIARFSSDLLKIKATIICNFYSPQALAEISGIMATEDAQYAQQAIQLLKTEPSRCYQIQVASDSMIDIDEQSEKQSRIEFLGAAGGFLKQAMEAGAQVPEMVPLLSEMLMFGVRAFKAGRPLESSFENAMRELSKPKEQQPDPEIAKAQQEQQIEQQKMQAESQKEMARLQADMAIEKAKLQMQAQFEQQKLQMEMQARQAQMEMHLQLENMRMQFAQWKVQKQAEADITVAEISAQSTLTSEQESAADSAAND